MSISTHQRDMKLARWAGVLYLLIFICAGFAEGYVRATVFHPGDPMATAAGVASNPGLMKLGLAADTLAFMFDAGVAVLLYILLRASAPVLALLAMVFRLIAHPAIATMNLVNHWAASAILDASGSFEGMGAGSQHALSLFFLEAHTTGYLLAGAFFGVSLIMLGILLNRSGRFPLVLGWLVFVAGCGYLIETFGMVIAPEGAAIYTGIVTVSAVVGEMGLCLWLIVKGIGSSLKGATTSP